MDEIPTNDFKGRLHQTDLEKHPDVARAVGMFAAAFVRLEQDLYLSFGKVLGSDYGGALKLLGHIQSFSTRLTAVTSFVPASALADEQKATATAVFGIAKECNNFRNRVLHGQWGLTPAGDLMLAAWATSTSKATSVKPMSAKIIDDRRTLDLERCVFLNEQFLQGKATPKGFVTKPTITGG